ncbi:MAG: phosphopantetheine-binding protein [Rhodospirillales bacterium]|nr:phosphopantetheine-binding protein [Rhodospirillales bacterium]
MEIRSAIAGYIEEVSNEQGFDHSANLFECGLLTSLDVLSLVVFIEDTFTLEISGDDVDMESFGTVDGLVAMVDANINSEKVHNAVDP